MSALNEQEKAKIRRYLGYQNWQNTALMWGVPFPTAIQPNWYINDAISRLSDDGLELVRRDLRELQCIEDQISDARKRLKATKVGDITMNPHELESLRGELEYWKRQLADEFASILNPVRQNTGGSRNGTVVG